MMLGLSLAAFTLLHVVISLIGIVAGLVWLLSAIRGAFLTGWNAIFLVTTILTSVTGFMFPFHGFTPALAVGGLSLVVLAVALLALYGFGGRGGWMKVYLGTATFALYLNIFVLVVQSFLKVGFLNALAPTGSEPPFVVVQAVALLACILLGILALRGARRLAL